MLGFLVLFAGMTIEVISRSGFDVLTGLATATFPDGTKLVTVHHPIP